MPWSRWCGPQVNVIASHANPKWENPLVRHPRFRSTMVMNPKHVYTVPSAMLSRPDGGASWRLLPACWSGTPTWRMYSRIIEDWPDARVVARAAPPGRRRQCRRERRCGA